MNKIYLDNAASTPLHPEVLEAMCRVMKNNFGNPSAIHDYGRKSRTIIENARKNIATGLNCSIGEIFFTSCGTESNNTILNGAIRDLGVTRIITTAIEHPCVRNTVAYISEEKGITVEIAEINEYGEVKTDQLEKQLRSSDKKTLVSIMHANNEIGTINDIRKIGKICRKNNALFHSDTIQTITHLPVDISALDINFLSGSAHKFMGPKGIGFFYMNSNSIFKPYLKGGGQERNMRSGTENIYGIHGLSVAYTIAMNEYEERHQKIEKLRLYLKKQLKKEIPGVSFNGCQEKYLNTILSASFPPHEKNEMLLMYLDMKGVAASGGSACSSGSVQPSQVLKAINADPDRKAIRFSFNHFNTLEELDTTVTALKGIYGL